MVLLFVVENNCTSQMILQRVTMNSKQVCHKEDTHNKDTDLMITKKSTTQNLKQRIFVTYGKAFIYFTYGKVLFYF